MNKLKVLDLFSGIGGFSLGLERTGGFVTDAFCEIDPACHKRLRKNFPGVPIFENVKTITEEYHGQPDLICGGYPCQGESLAGLREGAADNRWLWPEMFACVKKYRPSWVIGENVYGHISMGLDGVLSDLEGEGYACRPFVLPACALDAKHRRDRVWIVAHAERAERRPGESPGHDAHRQAGERQETAGGAGKSGAHGGARLMADTEGQPQRAGLCAGEQAGLGRGRLGHCSGTEGVVANALSERGRSGHDPRENAVYADPCREAITARRNGAGWPAEPGVGRVAYGIPDRLDRLKGLGNAVVPDIPEMFGYMILEVLKAMP